MTAPISVAALNAMQRITPTGYAEEGYQQSLTRARAMRVGPAGLPLPSPRSVFRPAVEGKLLNDLAARAYKDFAATELTAADHADTARALAEDTQALIAAEELGYERGLADGRAMASEVEETR